MLVLSTQTPGITWPQLVTAVVAALGFLLSLYNFWIARREKRPKLVVASGFALAASPRAEAFYTFTVANHGRIDVFVSQLYLEVGEQRVFFPDLRSERPLGSKLVPGEAITFFQESDPLHQVLRDNGFTGAQTFPLVSEDALGNRFSSGFKVDLGTP